MTFDDIFTFDNLLKSAKQCFLDVGWKASVQKYKNSQITNACKMLNKLDKPIYRSMPFYEFRIMERGKVRDIKSLHISERVMQKCLCKEYLVPLISKRLIYDNGACIKGKGIDFSRRRFVKHLRAYWLTYGRDGYVLTFDFSKYFENINHNILFDMLDKIIEDKEVLKLLKTLIKDFGDKGLGLGSEISQILALYYPNKIDRYIKETLRIKYYGRYMDDGYLIHHDKEFLQRAKVGITEIAEKLDIKINVKKTHINKISNGIVWLKTKYSLSETGKIIKKPNPKNIVSMRRKLKKFKVKLDNNEMSIDDIERSYTSWLGSIKKTNSYKTVKSMNELYNNLFIDN